MFLGIISIIRLGALDDTLFSFILGICAYLGGFVSGFLGKFEGKFLDRFHVVVLVGVLIEIRID